MKLCFFLLFVFALSSLRVQAGGIEKVSQAKKECDILVECGSSGGGIDYQTCSKIQDVISSMDFKKAFQWSWGLEGELSICLLLKPEQNKESILEELKSHVPEDRDEGPIEIKAK